MVDTLRFMKQYTTGYGDYIVQRERLFAGMTLDEITEEIKGTRKRGHPEHTKRVLHKKSVRSKRNHRPQARRQKATGLSRAGAR